MNIDNLKASNDSAIATWDLEIAKYQDLLAQYQAIGQTQIPRPEDRKPGTWGAGRLKA